MIAFHASGRIFIPSAIESSSRMLKNAPEWEMEDGKWKSKRDASH